MREQTDATKNNQRNDFVESETVSTDTDDENPIISMLKKCWKSDSNLMNFL
jgi:hypothetical protein